MTWPFAYLAFWCAALRTALRHRPARRRPAACRVTIWPPRDASVNTLAWGNPAGPQPGWNMWFPVGWQPLPGPAMPLPALPFEMSTGQFPAVTP